MAKLNLLIHEIIKSKLVASHLNDNLISYTVVISLVTNLGGNILMITLLIYGSLNLGQRILFTYMTLNQFALSLAFFWMFIGWSKSLNEAKSLLFRAQMKLDIWQIRNKIMLMRHFELVNLKPFKFSIGPFGRISTSTILKVCKFPYYCAISQIVQRCFDVKHCNMPIETYAIFFGLF